MAIFSSQFSKLISALRNGEVCVFNTDTVVGIGCAAYINKDVEACKSSVRDAFNIQNINRIFNIKKRSFDKKLPWLVNGKEMMLNISEPGYNGLENAVQMAENYWPGNTTLIIRSCADVDDFACGANHSLALRMPNVPYINKAISQIESPIVCTSANVSGESTVTDVNEVDPQILDAVDFVFDCSDGICPSGISSKIFDCSNNNIEQIR